METEKTFDSPAMSRSQAWKAKYPDVDFRLFEPNSPDAVPNSYIIRLKKDSRSLEEHLNWLKSGPGSSGLEDVKIVHEYELIKGYSAELTDDGMAVVAASPDVERIIQNSWGRPAVDTPSELSSVEKVMPCA
ncbi:hypothetical protein FRC12_018017 [Ceratobasidium sp. 428]|nr:hypothetical protein FRC12_018017 [Ceratobasidium sp. 428]